MKDLLEKSASAHPSSQESFGLISSGKAIVKALLSSKQSGNVVGIYSPAFGDGMFLTGVQDLYEEDKVKIAVFHRYDLSGQILSRNCISVDEIDMICSFDQRYRNPLLAECNTEENPGTFNQVHRAITTGNTEARGDILRYH